MANDKQLLDRLVELREECQDAENKLVRRWPAIIRQVLKATGLSLRKLADKMEISPAYLSQVMSGKEPSPRLELLLRREMDEIAETK